MRVVLTVHQFLPDYQAGTEILTFEAAKGLQALGHEVCIVTGFPALKALGQDNLFDSYVYKGIQVERFHTEVSVPGTEAEYRNLSFAARFRSFLESINPDVVHFFHLEKLSASAVEVCHEMGFATVLTPTDFWFVCPTIRLLLSDGSMCQGPKWKAANCVKHMIELYQPENITAQVRQTSDRLLGMKIWANQHSIMDSPWFAPHIRALAGRHVYLREQLNNIDRVLVPTHLMERVLRANGLDSKKVVFAPYGINLNYTTRSQRSREGQLLRVGFMGTLGEHKGAHVLLEAMKFLPAALPIELRVYGRMEDFPEYIARLRRLVDGDPRIEFCGTVPNAAIGQVFSELDLLVVPSIWYENTPLVIYSAQAAGCPVIASNLDGMAEVIHDGYNGLLFQPGDANDLAHALRRLYDDRQLLERLRKRAITPRSIQDYVKQMEAVYEDIWSERGEFTKDYRLTTELELE